MEDLGIVLDFLSKEVTIDHVKIPMCSINSIQNPNERFQIYKSVYYNEHIVTEEISQRTMQILDAKYEKANLPQIVKHRCKHLTSAQQSQLLNLLTQHESLFDGTLGDWNTSPLCLELKEGISPFNSRAFPVQHIHKNTLEKEVNRLKKPGVIKW